MSAYQASVERLLVATLLDNPDRIEIANPEFGTVDILNVHARAAGDAILNLRARGVSVTAKELEAELERTGYQQPHLWLGDITKIDVKGLKITDEKFIEWTEQIAESAKRRHADMDAAGRSNFIPSSAVVASAERAMRSQEHFDRGGGIATDPRDPLFLPGRDQPYPSEQRANEEELATLGMTVHDASGLADNPSVTMPPSTARLITMSTVKRETISWLWRARIARGLLNLIDGDPGVGKSTITIDIAARVTRGEAMPLETGKTAPADVLLIGAEDHLAATVLPRLMAAGADLSRVHVLEAVPREGDPDAPPTLADVVEIENIVAQKKIAVVFIDPLMAHLPSGTDAHRDSDMRAVLSPWAAMAQRTGVAVVIVRHLRKMGGPAIYRGSSSIGIIGAARSALLVGRDPDDPETCVLAHAKGNLAPPPPSLRYRVVDHDGVGRIEWIGTVDCSADRLAALPDARGEGEDNSREPVREALRQVLASGEVAVSEVIKDVIAMTGTSRRTIERAREDLGIKSAKRGKAWVLYLPGGGHESGDFRPSPPAQSGGGVDEKTDLRERDRNGMKTATHGGGLGRGGHESVNSATSVAPGGLGGVERQTTWSSAVYADARHRGLHDEVDDE